MNKLIIDAANKSIFLMIISDGSIYNISHENSKTNYEKLIVLVNDFLNSKNLKIKDISAIYVNRGPGSFAGIRNSLSIIKAIHLTQKLIIIVIVLGILIMLLILNMKIFPIYAINLMLKKI